MVKYIRFFCAGAILTASVIELTYSGNANASVLASPFGGVAAMLIAKLTIV